MLFNKVITAQYFVWYAFFTPFLLPSSWFAAKDDGDTESKKKTLVTSPLLLPLSLYLFSIVQWLWGGYNLEFRMASSYTQDVGFFDPFFLTFLHSLCFLAIQGWLFLSLLSHVYTRERMS